MPFLQVTLSSVAVKTCFHSINKELKVSQLSSSGVFLDASTLGNDIDLTQLGELSCQCWDMTSPEQVVERASSATYLITNKVQITETIMLKLPKLKLICVAATGMNNVDLSAANKLGIEVKNVTDYAGTSIAQLVFSYLSELLLHTQHYANLVQQGAWSNSPHFCVFDKPFVELAGKKIGLIGYGVLAKSVERVAQAYDMQVLISERKGSSEVRAGRVSFEQVIEQSDVLSIHCPLSVETENLISTPEFNKMKPSAVLVNTARGGIVNEQALLNALFSKQISGAATDVLTQEPPSKDHPMLINQPNNLIITPHIAWATKEARQRVLAQVIENIRSFTG